MALLCIYSQLLSLFRMKKRAGGRAPCWLAGWLARPLSHAGNGSSLAGAPAAPAAAHAAAPRSCQALEAQLAEASLLRAH